MLHHIHFNKHEHTNLYLYSGVGNGRPQFAGKMKQTKNGLAPKLAYKLYRSLTVIFVVAECHCLPLVALTDSASQDGNIVSYWRVQQMQAIAFRHATAAHSRLPTIHIRTFILLVSYMPLTNTFSFVFLNFSSSLSLNLRSSPVPRRSVSRWVERAEHDSVHLANAKMQSNALQMLVENMVSFVFRSSFNFCSSYNCLYFIARFIFSVLLIVLFLLSCFGFGCPIPLGRYLS